LVTEIRPCRKFDDLQIHDIANIEKKDTTYTG